MNWITQNLFDPYERKARVFPALLVALPLIVPLLFVYGPRSPYLTALFGLISSCGVIYALSSIARGRGKQLEEKLISKWGGLPTTLILRHRDTFLDSATTYRYHSEINQKIGTKLPDAHFETENPDLADEAYKGAVRHLRELTRGAKNSLLLKENIAYGFHRNMCAMRPFGFATSSIGFLIGLILSKTLVLHPWNWELANLTAPGFAGGITIVMAVAILGGWFHFSEAAVKQMGYVYAERLFESIKNLPRKKAASTK